MPTPPALHILLKWECTFVQLGDASRCTRAGAAALACEAAEAGDLALPAAAAGGAGDAGGAGAGAGADDDSDDTAAPPGAKRSRGGAVTLHAHENAVDLTALVVEWCGKQGVQRLVLLPHGGMMVTLRSPARPRDVGRCIARLISRAGLALPAVSFAAGYESWQAALTAADSRAWIGDAAAAPPAVTLGVCASLLAHVGACAPVGSLLDIAHLRTLCVEGATKHTAREWMPDAVWLAAADGSVVTRGRVFETTRVATHERVLTVPGLWATCVHFAHHVGDTLCMRGEWAIGFAGAHAGDPVRWQVVTAGAFTQLPGPGSDWAADPAFECGPLVTGRTPVAAALPAAAEAVAERVGADVAARCWTPALPALIAASVQAVDAGGDLHTEDGRCWRFVTADEAKAMPPWSAVLWGYRACTYASRSLDTSHSHDQMLALALMDKATEVTLRSAVPTLPLPDIGMDPYGDRDE